MWIIASTISCLVGFLLVPTETSRGILVALVLGVAFLAGVLTIISSIFAHTADVGRLRVQQSRITAAEERCERLQKSISEAFGVGADLDKDLLARANEDSPLTAIVEELGSAEWNLEGERNKLTTTQENIEARKTGPLAFVVNMYGEQ